MTKMERGDVVLVHWVDITGDGAGAVEDARAAECTTPGYFWGYKKQGGQRMLVLQLTRHSDGTMRGWDIYPVSVVKQIELLRKGVNGAKLTSEDKSGKEKSTAAADRGKQRKLFVEDGAI